MDKLDKWERPLVWVALGLAFIGFSAAIGWIWYVCSWVGRAVQ